MRTPCDIGYGEVDQVERLGYIAEHSVLQNIRAGLLVEGREVRLLQRADLRVQHALEEKTLDLQAALRVHTVAQHLVARRESKKRGWKGGERDGRGDDRWEAQA